MSTHDRQLCSFADEVISIGLMGFLFSLSFDRVMDRSIEGFQEKNTAFNNGYIKGAENLSYGVMPREGAAEIAFTPNLAKKFAEDIQPPLEGPSCWNTAAKPAL